MKGLQGGSAAHGIKPVKAERLPGAKTRSKSRFHIGAAISNEFLKVLMHERSFDFLIGGVRVSGEFDDSFKLFAMLRPIVQVIYGYLYVPGNTQNLQTVPEYVGAYLQMSSAVSAANRTGNRELWVRVVRRFAVESLERPTDLRIDYLPR